MAKKAKTSKKQQIEAEQKASFSPAQVRTFVDEVKVEFTKIVWPDRKVTVGLTGVVIVFSILVSLYLGSVDMVLGKLIDSILR
jgi:preprotein translocase subunit SecE